MKTSRLSTRTWFVVALFCAAAVSTCAFLVYRLSYSARTYDLLFDREIHDQTEVRLLQVGFKKQVQEWKDILLRGKDPVALRTHTAQFLEEDRKVNEIAAALHESVEDPSVRALVGRFIDAHSRLDANYLSALASFNTNGHDPFEADRMVRGQDRPPTDLLDRIAELMSEHTGHQVKAQNAASNRALVGLLVLIAVLLLIAVHRIIRVNRELAGSEERYRTLIEESPDAILATDLNEIVFMCNRKAAELLGYPNSGYLIGTGLPNLLDGSQSRDFAALVKVETTLRRRDGSTFAGEFTAAPLQDGQRRMIGHTIIVRDLTERRRAEETRAAMETHLQQARQLESIGRLAGGVAHDFNNLLTVINGYGDMVLRTPFSDEGIRHRVEQICNAGARAAELTRQLLAFGRKQKIQPTVMDVNTVVREVEEMFQRLLPENIDLVTHLEPSLGHIRADPGQIHQVLVNLVVNARDAMPQGGRLILETMNVVLDAEYASEHPEVTDGPSVLLQVTDTGSGMGEEVRAHIFEPFYTTKGTGMGTGLGLASSYGIVRQSGGWIWVYSEPGRGTSFKVYFPRTDAPPSHGVLAVAPLSLHGTETILVVEDRQDVLSLARDALESYGYNVLGASDGATALELADKHDGPIHLLLTDVVMPGMNGKELADRLVGVRPDTRILFMSGYSENVIFHEGILKPGIAHIPKPLMPEALAAKVRETIGPPRPSAG